MNMKLGRRYFREYVFKEELDRNKMNGYGQYKLYTCMQFSNNKSKT